MDKDEYISKDDVLCFIYALRQANGFKTENDFFWLHDKILNATVKKDEIIKGEKGE